MWLPVSLPVRTEPVPIDVALWLFELRHFGDCNEVLCNSKVISDCDSKHDSSCDFGAEELNKLGHQESEEDGKEQCCCEVQEYPNTAANYALKEHIPGQQIQYEECLNIHSEFGEDQNCPYVQEYPESSESGEAGPELLNQKKDIPVENQSGDEENATCSCQCFDNSTAQDVSGLLDWRVGDCVGSCGKGEQAVNCDWRVGDCVDSCGKDEQAVNCHCECPEQPAVIQDISGLQQREGGSIQTDRCDCDDASSLTVHNYSVSETGMVNAAKGSITRESQNVKEYEVSGESTNSNQALKCHSILWEANPLYCGVDVEGSERGFRKLCHTTSEHSDSSIHVGSGEETELSSCQINESIFRSVIEEHRVDSVLQTGCLLSKCGRFTSKCHLELHRKCGSLEEKPCVHTFWCGADLNTDVHLVGSNEAPSWITDLQEAEISGHSSGETFLSDPTLVSNDDDHLITGVNNSDSDSDTAVHYYPTSEYFGNGSEVTASCDEKCDRLLGDLELLQQSLMVATDNISGDEEVEPDTDFLKLCYEAQNLAEETIQQYSVTVTTKMKKARSITLSSELSDDVFFNCSSSEERSVMHPLPHEVRRHHSWDVNCIFDDGTTIPVPPARLKKNKDKSRAINASEQKITDEMTGFGGVPKCEGVNQSDETKVLGRETDVGNLVECQELLIMKRVTECTKEKRNARLMHHNEGRNLCSQGDEQYQCVPDCCACATDISIVVSHCSDSSVNGKGLESFESDDVVLRKSDNECDEYPDIVLTRTRPISSAEFPPSEQPGHGVSSAYDDRLQTENISVETSRAQSGILLQNRKGSTSSDITAWKQELQHSGPCYLDDEWDADCMLQPDEVGHTFNFGAETKCNPFTAG
jgi:hypothetical protein